MNNDQKLQQLEEYRAQALEKLSGMSEYLSNSEDVDYTTIISLAQSTGNAELFGKALEKIDQIENEQDRSEALLSFLDGIEYAIADDVHRQEPAQSEAA
jgi:hypothetical protein